VLADGPPPPPPEPRITELVDSGVMLQWLTYLALSSNHVFLCWCQRAHDILPEHHELPLPSFQRVVLVLPSAPITQ
jgi:hypothetical protein